MSVHQFPPTGDRRCGAGKGAGSVPVGEANGTGLGVNECTSTHSYTHTEKGEGTTIASTLAERMLDHGVFVLSVERRERIAIELAAEGMTADDVSDLANYIAENEPDAVKARRYVAAMLSDPARLKVALAGLAKWQARRETGAAPEPWDGTINGRFAPDAPIERDDSDRARQVVAMIRGDRKSVATVSTELQLSEREVERLRELGERITTTDAIAAARSAQKPARSSGEFAALMESIWMGMGLGPGDVGRPRA